MLLNLIRPIRLLRLVTLRSLATTQSEIFTSTKARRPLVTESQLEKYCPGFKSIAYFLSIRNIWESSMLNSYNIVRLEDTPAG